MSSRSVSGPKKATIVTPCKRTTEGQRQASLPLIILKTCKGPYRTTKQAVIDIFVQAHLAGYPALYYSAILELMALVDSTVTCVHHPVPRERIESAIKSLCYERRLKSRGDGHYFIHPLHLQSSLPNSSYNREKRKIYLKENKQIGGYVYYVRWENDNNYIKIGFSTNPCSRFNSFLTSSPHRLEIVRIQEVDGQEAEALLHQSFNEYRVAGEWFKYEKDIKAYIENISLDCLAGLGLEANPRLLVHCF